MESEQNKVLCSNWFEKNTSDNYYNFLLKQQICSRGKNDGS